MYILTPGNVCAVQWRLFSTVEAVQYGGVTMESCFILELFKEIVLNLMFEIVNALS